MGAPGLRAQPTAKEACGAREAHVDTRRVTGSGESGRHESEEPTARSRWSPEEEQEATQAMRLSATCIGQY